MPYLPRARKIKRLDALTSMVGALKKDGKTIVQAHGVFDLLHPAHIYHFEQAKKLGDVLLVSVVDDRFVQKGPGRPFFDEATRAEWLAALEIVDFVVFCGGIGPYEVIETVKPNFYVKGKSCETLLNDPLSGISKDKEVCEGVGTQLVFTEEMPVHSSGLFEKIIKLFN